MNSHSTPAAEEDDDGDVNERRERGLKRSCDGGRWRGGGSLPTQEWAKNEGDELCAVLNLLGENRV